MNRERTYDSIQVGEKASFSKTIGEHDVYTFAGLVGDFNPVHINEVAARDTVFQHRVAHAMLGASLISTVLGMELPGPGTIYLTQELNFQGPVYFGETITAECEVIEKDDAERAIVLSTTVRNQDDKLVVTGLATVKK